MLCPNRRRRARASRARRRHQARSSALLPPNTAPSSHPTPRRFRRSPPPAILALRTLPQPTPPRASLTSRTTPGQPSIWGAMGSSHHPRHHPSARRGELPPPGRGSWCGAGQWVAARRHGASGAWRCVARRPWRERRTGSPLPPTSCSRPRRCGAQGRARHRWQMRRRLPRSRVGWDGAPHRRADRPRPSHEAAAMCAGPSHGGDGGAAIIATSGADGAPALGHKQWWRWHHAVPVSRRRRQLLSDHARWVLLPPLRRVRPILGQVGGADCWCRGPLRGSLLGAAFGRASGRRLQSSLSTSPPLQGWLRSSSPLPPLSSDLHLHFLPPLSRSVPFSLHKIWFSPLQEAQSVDECWWEIGDEHHELGPFQQWVLVQLHTQQAYASAFIDFTRSFPLSFFLSFLLNLAAGVEWL